MPELYFRNFPETMTEEHIHALFASCGEVSSVYIFPPKPPITTLAGFIQIDDAGAALAIERLHGTTIEENPVVVEPSSRKKKKPAAPKGIIHNIAQQLGENDHHARNLINNLVRAKGLEFVQEMVSKALEIEAQGGMMTLNGSRRRSLGGIFFHIIKEELTYAVYATIAFRGQPQRQEPLREPLKFEGYESSLNWEDRHAVLVGLLEEKGILTNVKMTLVGRPGKIEKRPDLVILAMELTIKPDQPLPKGVPQPPQTPTLYTVYIAEKQWRKVEQSLENPDDKLVVEGVGTFDPDIHGMAVFATSVTSKLIQQAAKAEMPKAPAAQSPKPAAKPAAQQPPKATAQSPKAAAPPKPNAKPAQPPPSPFASLTPQEAQTKLVELEAQVKDTQGKLSRKEGSTFSLSQQIYKLELQIKEIRRLFDIS